MEALEIEETLPYFWAQDLENYLKNTSESAVFFIDTYEALWENHRSEGNSRDEWIREELIRCPPKNSLWVICGREKPKRRRFVLGDLATRIAHITPGQKVTYVTDIVFSPSNIEKTVELAENSDYLFIEAAFLEKHKSIAETKYHLTARQAGIIARKARVKQLFLFHFSPRYTGRMHLLQKEAKEAFENG